MNSYELSRKFFDWTFENPQKITPNHIALYFFCIEHCNRLGWKKNFGLPTTMAKEAIGIRSYNTYINTLNDLVEFGFLIMIEKSKNQYSSNIIALSKFDKALDKALDKAFIKHDTKQSESTIQSIDSIDKQITINKEPITIPFDSFWDLYPNKVAKKKCIDKWKNIKETDKQKILDTLPNFINYKPFETYNHPNPETYLNQERWNDELKPVKDKLFNISCHNAFGRFYPEKVNQSKIDEYKNRGEFIEILKEL